MNTKEKTHAPLQLIKTVSMLFVMMMLVISSVQAQSLKLKAKNVLKYSFLDYDKTYDALFTISSVEPFSFKWDIKKDAKDVDTGTLVMTAQANQYAINMLVDFNNFYGPMELYDMFPRFLLSKKVFEEVVGQYNSHVRMGTNTDVGKLTIEAKEKLPVTIDGKTITLDILKMNYESEFSHELWYVNNDANLPLILKIVDNWGSDKKVIMNLVEIN